MFESESRKKESNERSNKKIAIHLYGKSFDINGKLALMKKENTITRRTRVEKLKGANGNDGMPTTKVGELRERVREKSPQKGRNEGGEPRWRVMRAFLARPTKMTK